jgi:hypothetical protein
MGFGSRGGFTSQGAAAVAASPTKVLKAVAGVAKSPAVNTPTYTLTVA